MSAITKTDLYEHVARIGKAMASPKRLELIELLAQGEKTVELLATQSAMDVRPAPTCAPCARHAWSKPGAKASSSTTASAAPT